MAHINFNRAIQKLAHEMPAHIAFRAPRRIWTYAEVEQEANRIANGFTSLGIGPGHRVACLTKHLAECTILVLAANKIGAVCMPVNWRLAGREVEYIVTHGEAQFMMADPEFLPLLRDLALPGLRKTVATVAADGVDQLAQWSAAFPDSERGYCGRLGDAALQLYSSGTTGLPKGVELSHRNLLGVCRTIAADFGYAAGNDVTFNAAPTFHIGGLGMAFVALYAGSTTVAYPDFDPQRVLAAFGEHRITHTFMVPAMIRLLLQTSGVEHADFSTLRVMGYGASPIGEQVLVDALRVFKCRFVQNYGLTETTGTIVTLAAADHDPAGPRADLLRAAGRACPTTRLRIVDTASRRDLPDGQVGEVWIHSPQNMNGYWRNERATQEAFPEGRADGIGWLRSGDAGYLQDGYLFIQDRIKDMIISGGENIYPIEVENVLMKHPAVSDCAIIAVPDEKWGETVKACVVRKPDTEADAQELISFCREQLAHYKCPRSVDFLDALPRNPTGKILKKALREPYWNRIARKVN